MMGKFIDVPVDLNSEELLGEIRIDNNMFRSHETCNAKDLRSSLKGFLRSLKKVLL